MKFKTTQRKIKENFNNIIRVPYCGLQNLLNYEVPIAYTVRREGWGTDIYDIGGGIAIATGYRPFGNICPNWEIVEKYEEEAEKIRYNCRYEEGREALKNLLKKFIEEVIKHG